MSITSEEGALVISKEDELDDDAEEVSFVIVDDESEPLPAPPPKL